ncbi:MAG: hypothetical protein LBG58_12045 [Planctomycetaceae bacterium]|nr:hypothetical protein [Planctomycetaceae bacterium]
MKRNFVLILFMLFFFVTNFILSEETDIKTIQIICNRAIENRLKIKQWHVKLDCTNTGSSHFAYPTSFSFFVDGHRKREDQTMPNIDVSQYVQKIRNGEKVKVSVQEDVVTSKEGGTKTTVEILGDEFYYRYQKDNISNLPTVPLYQLTQTGNQPPSDSFITDFRILGFLPLGLNLGNSSIYSFIGNLKELEGQLTMTDEFLNDTECKKILYVKEKDEYHFAVWIAPQYGYSPIRMESQTKKYGLFDSTTVEVRQYKDTDLWVPVKATVQRLENGKLFRKTEYAITVYSINEPLDPKLFTPELLDIPVGTPVEMFSSHNPPNIKRQFWDGKKTVTEGELFIQKIQDENAAKNNKRRILGVVSGLILISIVCFYKFFTRRKS